MAPSPELGGQPKAPDKAGADTTTPSSTLPPDTPSSSSANTASNLSNSLQSSGAKHTLTGTTTLNLPSSTSPVCSNINNNSGSAAAASSQQPQDSSKIDNMEESDLKALLEEAITYKRPKDREHKSSMFNELLSKTEKEDQEQNFPFTSRAVQSKRASGRPTQGGSLQDLQEASLHDYYYPEFPYSDYSYLGGGLGVPPSRRHQGSSSTASSGPGGGDRATNPRQKRYSSSVSSRQREGGSLPSNVNVECSFFNEGGHHHTTGAITKFKKRESGAKSDYGTMLLTAPLTSDGAAQLITAVAEAAGSTGLCGGMKNTESQLIDGIGGGVGAGQTVIDMESETQHLLAHDALQPYDSGLDDLEAGGIDLYGNSTASGGNSAAGGTGSSSSALKKIPRFPTTSYTSHAKLEIGEPSSTVRPSSVHHVDKTVPLPLLENNKHVDIIQLNSNYQAVKSVTSSDSSKQVTMSTITNSTKYVTTHNFNQLQKYLDENGNSVQQFNSGSLGTAATSVSGTGAVGTVSTGAGIGGNNNNNSAGAGGKKSRKQPKPKDRNTVLVIPENIAGYRGKEDDIESLVCYIENKDKQKDSKGGGSGGSSVGGGSGSNPKNGTVMKVGGSGSGTGNAASTGVENGMVEEKSSKKKNDKKKEKAKLKKSNSLEELSSCSRKKQQAEEEIDVSKTQEMDAVVTLRTSKNNKKVQNTNHTVIAPSTSSSASSTTSSQSSKETVAGLNTGKRGERRSWGTEELSYFDDTNQHHQVDEKSSKKEGKKDTKDIADPVLHTFNLVKKRDSLRMSVESLSAVSAGGGSETAEFHVVTKKKKTKKKSQSLLVDESSIGAVGYTNSGTSSSSNKRNLTASQSYSIGSSVSRNTTIGGKYQASSNFVNDRDVYMNSLASNSDVSRRKSTSSVPPSEKSDSSDADSVQSLPIEPTRKQQQQQNTNSGRNSAVSVPQSYADIARIPNADKINNNMAVGNNTSNSSTSPLDSTSVDKWPPVQGTTTSEDLAQALRSPSAFPELVHETLSPAATSTTQQQQQQYQQHQYVNSSVISVNNSNNILGNNNKATYSQSLLIAAPKVEDDEIVKQRSSTAAGGKVVSSTSSEHNSVNNSSNNNNSSSISNSSSSSSSKLALHKSKSVDNNDIYYSKEHYPALEKTVKPTKVVSAATTTINSNLLESKTASSVGKASPTINVAATNVSQQSSVNSNTTSYVTVNATSTTSMSNTFATNSTVNNVTMTGAKKSKKKDLTSTSSISAAPVTTPNEVESINNARNVADIINNNPVLIEHVTDIATNSESSLANISSIGNNNNNTVSTYSGAPSSSVTSAKRPKREKINANIITPQQPYVTHSHSSASAPNNTGSCVNSNHRPAVIIMNDNNEPNPKHEFTFGFDIDQELLFGDFHEDEMNMLEESQTQQHQLPQQLHHQSSGSTENVPAILTGGNNLSQSSPDQVYSVQHQQQPQQNTIPAMSPTNTSVSQQHHKNHQQHHYHNQSQSQPQQATEKYEMVHNSTDPDTYRDSIEHKFHQPPPTMVPLYSQPPPQLPPPHVLAAQQQSRQSRSNSVAATNHYSLPPPPLIPGHIQQQPPQVVLPTKQDSATNTPPATAVVLSATSPPAIITVPPPPLPPVVPAIPVVVPAVPVVTGAAIPVVMAQPIAPVPAATVVILPAGPPPPAAAVPTNNATVISINSNTDSCCSTVSSNSNSSTSLNNQVIGSSGTNSTSSSTSSICSSSTAPQTQEAPKSQRQTQQQNSSMPTVQQQPQPPIREKIKEIKLRFIAPEQLQTNHNHDKIVNFVGMAWEDIICGTNGSAKYYDGQ